MPAPLEVAEQALKAPPEPLNTASDLAATGGIFCQISGNRW
jgi:hypothetical protein